MVDPAARPGAPVRKASLSVAGGSGGGEYLAGTLVHIWADPPAPGSVFDRWTGDLEPLIDRYAAHTTLVMPASRVAVSAVFKRAPTCEPATMQLAQLLRGGPVDRIGAGGPSGPAGRAGPGTRTAPIDHGGTGAPGQVAAPGVEVSWCLPARHSGIVLLFHGHEGSGASFFRNTEPWQFARDALAAGFGLVALDSADREHKGWQLSAAGINPDVRNLRAVLEELVRRKLVDRQEPLYALGVAGGARFAALAAPLLRCKAVALFFAPGNLPPNYEVPTIWLMAQNAVNREPRALAEYTRLAQRQVPAQFNINDPSPVYPLRFQRIRGVAPADSNALYRLLKDRGFLDAQDMLKQDPESSGWETTLPPRFARLRGAVREQLDVCFSLPRFYSDFDNRILDFFNEHR